MGEFHGNSLGIGVVIDHKWNVNSNLSQDPILGYLDDMIIGSVGIWLAIRLIPSSLFAEHRQAALARSQTSLLRYVGVAMILCIWCMVGGAIIYGLMVM